MARHYHSVMETLTSRSVAMLSQFTKKKDLDRYDFIWLIFLYRNSFMELLGYPFLYGVNLVSSPMGVLSPT